MRERGSSHIHTLVAIEPGCGKPSGVVPNTYSWAQTHLAPEPVISLLSCPYNQNSEDLYNTPLL